MTIFDDAIGLAIDLEKIKKTSRRKALRSLDELEKEILAILASGELSVTGKRKLNRLLIEIREAITITYNNEYEAAKTDLTDLSKIVADYQKKSLEKVAINPIKVPSTHALEALTSEPVVQGAVLKAWWDKQGEDAFFRYKAIIQQGIVNSKTNQQIIKNVKDSFVVTRRHAATLVQTSTNSIANAAGLKVYEQNSDVIQSLEWLATLDLHTCPLCAVRDQKEWDTVTKKPIKHSIPFAAPPIHPNDRCILMPSIKLEGLPPERRARADDNKNQSFEEWLDNKPKSYADEILGKGRADLWRKKIISFEQLLSGGKELTLEQLKAKYA